MPDFLKISGTIIKGSQDGRKLGFPTANVQLAKPLDLEYGVYACTMSIASLGFFNLPGVAHFGPRVVFGETHPQLEVHLFDFDTDLYGQVAEVTVLLPQIRGTQQFGSLEALKDQISRDCVDAQEILKRSN